MEFIRLFVIAFCGAFGMFCLTHTESHAWIGVGLVLLGIGLMSCFPRVRVTWVWVIIIRDLTRRFR